MGFSISSLPEPQYNSIHPPFEVTTSIQIQIIMSDIAKGVGNLFAAVVDIIKGIFATVFNLFQTAINTVIGLFKNVFNLAEGVVGFIIGNIFIIGTLCAVYFGYQLYQNVKAKTLLLFRERQQRRLRKSCGLGASRDEG